MPALRVPGLPQINGQFIYGQIPIEAFPSGPEMDQESMAVAMPVWFQGQWYMAMVHVAGGLDISYNAGENTLEFYFGANRSYGVFFGDAIILKPTSSTFTADAVLA